MTNDDPGDEARRTRQRLLGELLDQLEAAHGPADERLVRKYVALLE